MNKINLTIYGVKTNQNVFIEIITSITFMWSNLGSKFPKNKVFKETRNYTKNAYVGKADKNAKYNKSDGTQETPLSKELNHSGIFDYVDFVKNKEIYDNAVKENNETPGQNPEPKYVQVCGYFTSNAFFKGSKNCSPAQEIKTMPTKLNGQPGKQYISELQYNFYIKNTEIKKNTSATKIIHQILNKKEIEKAIEQTPKKD